MISKDLNNLISDPMKIFLPIKEKKVACFTCFKLHAICNSIEFSKKKFCCENCKNKFEEEYFVKIKYFNLFFIGKLS